MRIVYAAVVYLCVLCVPVGAVCAAAPAETGAAGGIPAAAANAADAFPGLTESGHATGRSEAHVQTAESIFRGLPASIFGNTVEPITEEAKQKLLEFGYIANWVILESRPLFMRISAVSQSPAATSAPEPAVR